MTFCESLTHIERAAGQTTALARATGYSVKEVRTGGQSVIFINLCVFSFNYRSFTIQTFPMQ